SSARITFSLAPQGALTECQCVSKKLGFLTHDRCIDAERQSLRRNAVGPRRRATARCTHSLLASLANKWHTGRRCWRSGAAEPNGKGTLDEASVVTDSGRDQTVPRVGASTRHRDPVGTTTARNAVER